MRSREVSGGLGTCKLPYPLARSCITLPHASVACQHANARSTRRSTRRRSPHDLAALCSVLSPRRVRRIRPHSDGNRAAPKGHGSRSPDLAATARRVSAARPMRAYVQSSDRAPRPGWARDAHRKKPSRTDGERSGASRSLSDRAARRRTCADARTSGRNPAPRLAAICPS